MCVNVFNFPSTNPVCGSIYHELTNSVLIEFHKLVTNSFPGPLQTHERSEPQRRLLNELLRGPRENKPEWDLFLKSLSLE